MDNKITEQLRAEAKDALVHWAKIFHDEICLGEIF